MDTLTRQRFNRSAHRMGDHKMPHVHHAPAGICNSCGREMRWGDEPPGPPRRHNMGRCCPCKEKADRHAGPEETPEREDTTIRDRDWIDDYVARRRRQGIDPNGVIMDGEPERRHPDAWVRPQL
ncbi:MAG TPA: hypothetical protein VIG41_13450 [Micrococcaceae bacterium]|jgi:hypothetical protein